jgi:hypothetical protein
MHERIANKILLAMEHEFKRSITVLAFDDETFARQLYPLLIASIGSASAKSVSSSSPGWCSRRPARVRENRS